MKENVSGCFFSEHSVLLAQCDAHSSVADWHFAARIFVIIPSRRLDCCLVADVHEQRLRSSASQKCVVMRAPSVIEHLQLLDPDYGTVFHRT